MAKWTRNHIMEIGGLVLALGLVATILAFTLRFATTTPSWLAWYANLVQRPEGDYNLIAIIAGPILLIMGGFYVGEQMVLRRRFEKMLDTPQRGEFAKRRRDLEDLAKRLPTSFEDKIEAKEGEFKSKRAT